MGKKQRTTKRPNMTYSSDWYGSFCRRWMKEGWDMERGLEELAAALSVSYEAAQAVWSLAQRRRGTEAHIRRVVSLARDPAASVQFDWSSVTRGEEEEALVRLGF